MKDNDLLKQTIENTLNNNIESVKHDNVETDVKTQKNIMSRERKTRDLSMPKGARVPLYEQKTGRFKLSITPGCVGRVVIDEGDRINQFITAGWRIVESEDKSGENIEGRSQFGSAIRRTMDKTGRQGILMEISKNLFEQDMEMKRKRINETTKHMSTEHVKGNKYYGGVTFGQE